MRKLMLKIRDNPGWKWVHFSYVHPEVYDAFFRAVNCKKAEIAKFLSMWARADFKVTLSMETLEDVQRLKHLVETKYRVEYSELYLLHKEENPKITGWVRMWVSQHMRVETAARTEDYNG